MGSVFDVIIIFIPTYKIRIIRYDIIFYLFGDMSIISIIKLNLKY